MEFLNLGVAPPPPRGYGGSVLNDPQLVEYGATKNDQRIWVRRFAGNSLYHAMLDTPLRVAHLTDIHVGFVTPMKVQRAAVAITNASKPDIVVITGDFVCHSHAFLEDLAETIRGFDAPVFAVLGNHDYWSGAPGVRRALRQGGAELLSNANTVITLRGQRFQLVGLDDAYTGHADRRAALKGWNPKLPTLGLSHIAEEADSLWQEGVPLVLSGHTHAGQLTVARLHELTIGKLAGHRYIHGLYGSRKRTGDPADEGAVYVGAGIGAAIMPLRVGERGQREITLFDLGLHPDDLVEHHAEQIPMRPPLVVDELVAQAEAHARFQARRKKRFRAPKVD